MWLPYVPRWLAWLGLDGMQIGLLGAQQPLLRWVSAIALAAAVDRWRVRHRLLVVTACAGSLCFLALVGATRFETLLVVFAAIALLHGSLIPLVDATVLDHLPRLGGDYARLRVAGSVSFAVGALASAPILAAWSPAALPWLLLSAQVVVAPALLGLPRAQLGHAHEVRPPWRLLTPPMRAFLATAFLLQVSCGAWGGFFAIHTAALGLSDAVPGLAWGLGVVAEILLFRFGRGLVGRFTATQLIGFTLVVTVVRWAATAVATSAPAVVALQLGHAVTFSVFHLATMLLLPRLVPAASSTSGQGLYGFVGFGLGGSAGFALAGLLVDRIGTAALFGLEAAIAALAWAPAWRLARLLR
ncbi:MAG: MFS transporter [bacterium]|nr:MFS transporter [bacterium]